MIDIKSVILYERVKKILKQNNINLTLENDSFVISGESGEFSFNLRLGPDLSTILEYLPGWDDPEPINTATSPKYVLHPGRVVSRTDGDLHYISAGHLMRLYNVSPEECVIAGCGTHTAWMPENMIHLYPRSDGQYPDYGKKGE